VTDDGAETDLDLGHYERFTHARMSKKNNFTSGSIYYSVISKERRGDYLGGTVQVIPHVTDEIKTCIRSVVNDVDLVIVEIGGPWVILRACPFWRRSVSFEVMSAGKRYLCPRDPGSIHEGLRRAENQTDPAQRQGTSQYWYSTGRLVVPYEQFLAPEIKGKIGHFCNVDADAVITPRMWTASTKYLDVPSGRAG